MSPAGVVFGRLCFGYRRPQPWLTLRGPVSTAAILGEIERAVWSILGVTQIDNWLYVA